MPALAQPFGLGGLRTSLIAAASVSAEVSTRDDARAVVSSLTAPASVSAALVPA